jgi:pimeloyl-ACP methyl ester carboxylesterase
LIRVLQGYVSETTITRFISPDILEGDVEGYEAPYRHLAANARPSVEDFAYMGTGIPHFLLKDLRETPPWKIFEAICGPRNFSGLNSLALLSERGDNARSYWQRQQPSNLHEATESRPKIVVVFGERDPLVENYKETLVRVIGKNNMADWAPDGIWLQNAGHYPMEDKPEDVARLIARLA